MATKEIEYIPYGFCAWQRCICPTGIRGECGLNGKYYECEHFRKAGHQRGLKEVDDNGKVRIHLADSQGIIKGAKTRSRQSNNSSVQTVLDNRVRGPATTHHGEGSQNTE